MISFEFAFFVSRVSFLRNSGNSVEDYGKEISQEMLTMRVVVRFFSSGPAGKLDNVTVHLV